MTGKLIIIEGIDGAGKSTLIEALKKFFRERTYVINYSYPDHSWEMNQNAAEARGQYYASIKIFKEILTKEKDRIIICDRFHLGEYTYGPVKRFYPEWLAEEVLKVEDELLKEIGKENIRLIILGVSEPMIALQRSKREGEYLKDLEEYREVEARYVQASVRTKLPMIAVYTDIWTEKEVFEKVIKFVREKIR